MNKNQQKKILILSWRGPGHPLSGGAEIATLEYAKYWVKNGYDVTFFTSKFIGCKKDFELIDGVKIIRRANQVLGVHLNAFLWLTFQNKQKFDLIIDQFHGISFFTPFYIRTKKTAFIHEVAKEVWWLNPLPKPLNIIVGFIGYFLEPVMFWFYKNIPFQTVSESTKEDLMRWGIPKQNIKVIHVGANLKKAVLKPKHKTPIITFLGALTEDKGISDALDIFTMINKSLPNSKFWIIGKGEGEYLETIKKKVSRLSCRKSIRFFGFVSENKKFDLLARSWIVINPSIREGWGIVVIEAASVGTPTIAYNVVGLRNSVLDGKTGILCKKKNVEQMAEKSLELILNQSKYQKFSQNCINWSKNFSWSSSNKQSLKFIKDIIDSRFPYRRTQEIS